MNIPVHVRLCHCIAPNVPPLRLRLWTKVSIGVSQRGWWAVTGVTWQLAELRAEKGTQMSDAKQQLAACEALATSLKQDLTSAEAAAAAARVEAERHRAIANRLSAANDAMQAQLSAALEPADSNASAAPEEATVEQESAEESAEARITADGGKIVKKVLWDVNKLQKENAALLEAVATQAAHRETLQVSEECAVQFISASNFEPSAKTIA